MSKSHPMSETFFGNSNHVGFLLKLSRLETNLFLYESWKKRFSNYGSAGKQKRMIFQKKSSA